MWSSSPTRRRAPGGGARRRPVNRSGRTGAELGPGVGDRLRVGQVAPAGGLVRGPVEDALAGGDDGRHQRLPGDVGGGADHVQDRVDGQQQADALQRQAQRAEGQGQHDGRAGQAGGGRRADHRDEGDQQVVADAEVDAEDLRHEDRGERRVDRGAAVHLGGRAERHRERGVLAGHAEALDGPLGDRHGADRGAGDEGQLDRRPGAGEEAQRVEPAGERPAAAGRRTNSTMAQPT